MKITKQEFRQYEQVRESGAFNMITHSREAARAANLSTARYIEVLKNYEVCMKKWPDVRKNP